MHGPKKVMGAISWNIVFSLVAVVIQIVITMVMARLLAPADYGVFAFANAIVVFGMHVSQRGISTTILRQAQLSPTDISCSYLACAAISGAFIVILLLGVQMLRLTAGSTLKVQSDIMLFMAIPLVIGIMATPATALLQRRLAMVRANVFVITGILLGNGGVAASFAMFGYGPWSLALGAATASITTAALTLWAERPPLHIIWDSVRFRELLREAVALSGIRAVGAAWVQIPLIILGLKSPSDIVGLYQRMQFFADILFQTTVCRVTGVFYVALALRGEDYKRCYRLLFLLAGTIIFPIVAFVWTAADPLIEVLLGPKWVSGSWVFRFLIVAFGIYTLNNQAAGIVLEMCGRLHARFASLSVATILILGLLLFVPSGSLEIVALPAIGSIIVSSVVLHAFMSERLRDLGELFVLLKGAILLGLATAGGSLIGAGLAAQLNIGGAFFLLIFQFSGALFFVMLATPIVTRIENMKPFLKIAKQVLPGLYTRLHFIHGQI